MDNDWLVRVVAIILLLLFYSYYKKLPLYSKKTTDRIRKNIEEHCMQKSEKNDEVVVIKPQKPVKEAQPVIVKTWMFIVMWTTIFITVIASLGGGTKLIPFWIVGGLVLHILGKYVNLKMEGKYGNR